MAAVIIHIAECGLQEIGWFNTLVSNLAHAVVVIAHHGQVHIIVPWNEAFMSDRTQQSASFHPAFQVVFFAEIEEALQQIKFHSP